MVESFSSSNIYSRTVKTRRLASLWQRSMAKYPMNRPVCQACNQRPCAVNYHKDSVPHYRSRCENCLRKGKGLKPREPRWKSDGYKKKPACDRCGFRAKHASQLLVFHLDGNLSNSNQRNLRTICLNCTADLKRSKSIWQPGDLEPDS